MPGIKWHCIGKDLGYDQYRELMKTMDYDKLDIGSASTYRTRTFNMKRDGRIIGKTVENTETGLFNVYEAVSK